MATYINTYDEVPTRLEMALALFTRTGTSEGIGSVHSRSVRIPTIANYTIEALAEYSGLSVNKVIVQLLEVALDEVCQGMTEEQRTGLFAIRSKHLSKELDKDGILVIKGAEQAVQGEV